jgi:hypothetical protein
LCLFHVLMAATSTRLALRVVPVGVILLIAAGLSERGSYASLRRANSTRLWATTADQM